MELHDHDIPIYGKHLKGKRIAFVVTGGIAAYTAPSIIRALRRYSCEVYPYATQEALTFITPDTLSWCANQQCITKDTWRSEHLGQGNQTFDAVVVYPTTYDFISKMSLGVADDICSSLIASHIAIAPIFMFPTMHGNMWKSPIVEQHIQFLENQIGINVIGPRMENGKANIPDTQTCVCNVVRGMSDSQLWGVPVLVTAGPTPVKIDNVRRITNRFSGKLGIEIANELWLRGADVHLYQSASGIRPPSYILHTLFDNYDEYEALCISNAHYYNYMISSAAVADYKPVTVVEGKIPSKGAINSIPLTETKKVIDEVLKVAPNIKLISFKYEEGKTLSDLTRIAEDRLDKGHFRVVANDISLNIEGQQKCFLIGPNWMEQAEVLKTAIGKINIARMIADDMEMDLRESKV